MNDTKLFFCGKCTFKMLYLHWLSNISVIIYIYIYQNHARVRLMYMGRGFRYKRLLVNGLALFVRFMFNPLVLRWSTTPQQRNQTITITCRDSKNPNGDGYFWEIFPFREDIEIISYLISYSEKGRKKIFTQFLIRGGDGDEVESPSPTNFLILIFNFILIF